MNNRTKARHLVMVNWRGIVFQPFELDQHVTVLEGGNGAGKTTAMAAALVVLMPAQRYLHLTSVGESTASGGDRGLYGRLGNPAQPSWAAIDVVLTNGARCIVGVQIDQKSPPLVDITPFVIDGIDPQYSLKNVFIDTRHAGEWRVPDRATLKELVGIAGGKAQFLNKHTQYFDLLFDRGIVPMRMSDDSEALKHWADLLRTSMSGGLSRLVTSGLKNFLLRPEDNLSRTLEEIKKNLVDCRMTHQMVKDAKTTHKHITAISEAGKTMLSSAANAVCVQEQDARDAYTESNRKAEKALDRRDATKSAVEVAKTEAKAAEEAADQADETARKMRDRAETVAKAFEIYTALNIEIGNLAKRKDELETAEELFELANSAHRKSKESEDRTRDQANAAAAALHNAKAEHEGAQSRYLKHRAAVDRISRLKAATKRGDIPVAALQQLALDLKRDLDGVTDQLNSMARKLHAAERDRVQFESALSQLSKVEEGSPTSDVPADRAMAVLARSQRALFEHSQIFEWRSNRDRLKCDATKRASAEALAKTLKPTLPSLTYEAVQEASSSYQIQVEELKGRQSADKSMIERLDENIVALEKQTKAALDAKPKWQSIQDQAANIALLSKIPMSCADDVRRIWQTQSQRAGELKAEISRLEMEFASAKNLEQRLAGVGLGVPQQIASARDIIGGELLIDRYEHTPLERAAHVQAALGPWVEAIQVKDIEAAAASIITMEDPPLEVRLLTATSQPPDDCGDSVMVGDQHILVADGPGRRLARLSDTPVIGKLAREQRLESLRKDIQARESDLIAKRSALTDSTAIIEAAHKLLPDVSLLGTTDPSEIAAGYTNRMVEIKRQRTGLTAGLTTIGLNLTSARKHLSTTHDLLKMGGNVLDGHDISTRLASATAQVDAAEKTIAWWKRHAAGLAIIEQAMPILRDPPLTPDAIASMAANHAKMEKAAEAAQAIYDDARILALEPEPLSWTDAEANFKALEGRWSIAEEKARHAKDAWEIAIQNTAKASKAQDEARRDRNDAEAIVTNTQRRVSGLQEDFDRLQVADPTKDMVAGAKLEADLASKETGILRKRHTDAAANLGRLSNQLSSDEREANEATTEANRLKGVWEPHRAAWDSLHTALEKERLLAYCTFEEGPLRRLSPQAQWTLAQRAVGSLISAIRDQSASAAARDEGRQAVIDALNEVKAQAINGHAAVAAWLAVNAWVQKWLPSSVATVADLFLTLQRHKSYLDMLDEEYRRHEEILRTQTRDIARKLTNARSAAIGHINALNNYLSQAKFGGIIGVRIQHERNHQAERALAIMRGDGNQQILWDSNRSFAESLGQLLEEKEGDPERYLDYRTYLDLHVQVQRTDGSWDEARSQAVSTGEAIGTGFSLMVSTLLHWESVYGPVSRGGHGGLSLRLLFLDEVSRLDLDSQASLTRLCAQGELQILIAAPSFDGSESSTVYRLTRIGGAEGQVRANRVVVRVGRKLEAS